jgi:hypothetical protein
MKTAVSFFEQNGGTYSRVGDVFQPDLNLEETENKPTGKYGRMRKRYLKEHHPAVYSAMLLNGELYGHLAEIDEACEKRMELLTRQMAKRENVTEMLKADDQMEWVRRMYSIRSRAEEIVMRELMPSAKSVF